MKLSWFASRTATAVAISATSARAIRSDRSRGNVIAAKTSAAQTYRIDEYASGWKPSLRMYFETVKLSAHNDTVVRSIRSAVVARRTLPKLPIRLFVMPQPTIDDVDALVGPATPHFAYQLRARIRELVHDLPENDEVRRYAEKKMELLDRLGHASSRAEAGGRVRRDVPGWEKLKSSAPADEPL